MIGQVRLDCVTAGGTKLFAKAGSHILDCRLISAPRFGIASGCAQRTAALFQAVTFLVCIHHDAFRMRGNCRLRFVWSR